MDLSSEHFNEILSHLPIFPLPNLVLFPGIIQPLHIFEPRYRFMVESCLKKDPFMAITLLKPGWQDHYYGSPEVFSTACIGEIVHHEVLNDGRYNILLRGFHRIMIDRFIEDLPYRQASVHLLDDTSEGQDLLEVERESAAIRACLNQLAIEIPEIRENVNSLLREVKQADQLADFVAYFFIPDLNIKQKILETLHIPERITQIKDAVADILLRVYSELHASPANPIAFH